MSTNPPAPKVENPPILAKSIVNKWLDEMMSYQYSITVYPKDKPFGERFIRTITDRYEASLSGDKLVIQSNDPIELAKLSIALQTQGYLVD